SASFGPSGLCQGNGRSCGRHVRRGRNPYSDRILGYARRPRRGPWRRMIDSNDATWQDFLAAANDYIVLVDGTTVSNDVGVFAEVHRSLLELQLAALDLPE